MPMGSSALKRAGINSVAMPITYPSRSTPDAALGPQTLALASAQVLSWRQGAGSIGGLHLHDCWNDDSVLSRGYHGPTAAATSDLLDVARELAQSTLDAEWAALADNLAAQLLWQQSPGGGFFHASGEYEPTYTPQESCPIHQMMPLASLLRYHETQPPGAPLRLLIENVAARQMRWFNAYWWQRGNAWSGPLAFPGWCGVVNQDLVAVAALARYGRALGDWKPFEKFGLPALETYLGPRYFNPRTGLFLRGDRPHFTERSNYMGIILDELETIAALRPDAPAGAAIERVAETLARAVFFDENGEALLYWGADDEATARAGDLVWDRTRSQLFPKAVRLLRRQPAKAEAVERTLARFVFADGTFAGVPRPENPLFSIAPSAPTLAAFWKFLVQRNPAGVLVRDLPPVPCVRRHCGDISFTSFDKGWVIRRGDEVQFRGVKQVGHGVLRARAELPNYAFCEPEPEFIEQVGPSSFGL
jgi:hypothetical protein